MRNELIKTLKRSFSTERTRDSLKFARSDSSSSSSSSSSSPGLVPSNNSGNIGHGSSNNNTEHYEPIASTSSIPYNDQSTSRSTKNNNNNNSDTNLILQPNQLPFPSPNPLSINRLPFSTHKFVKSLELNAGLDRKISSELMRLTLNLLIHKDEITLKSLLSKQDLENEAYLFTAALSELKTEFEIKSRNDGITLKSLTIALQRDTDALSQRMKEDLARLQSDIQLDMNQRKEETSTELKDLEMSIMDLNSKYTLSLSDLRTEIEATKWISTRRVMSALIVIVVACIATITTKSSRNHQAKISSPTGEGKEGGEGGGSGGEKRNMRTIEDMGIRIGREEDSEEIYSSSGNNSSGGSASGGKWFWSNGVGGLGERVAGEGEVDTVK